MIIWSLTLNISFSYLRRFFILASVCFMSMSLFPVQAVEKMYGVISAGYSDAEFHNRQEESFGYRILLGHQFHPQWYVETGYLKLSSVESEMNSKTPNFVADALYLGVLGKASHSMGELFYRLGVARVDVAAEEPLQDNNQCKLGMPSADGQGKCIYDEGIFAGIVGLGYDYYIASKVSVRFEADYIRGKYGFDTSVISVGVRYNFN